MHVERWVFREHVLVLNLVEVLRLTPIILGEIRFGIYRLPAGKRRQQLDRWFREGVARIACVPWDAACGLRWAQLLADLRRQGQAMPIKDSLIAATVLVHGLTVVTRNEADFKKAGVKVVNPFA
ncbi:MAG: type II toxin-antitoxin system VapC family toxin [Verrucomicrobiae bacterium]|nr:type II toxin-antitoxin system VapC family toxin [Verrucomicrobiae bacterium]